MTANPIQNHIQMVDCVNQRTRVVPHKETSVVHQVSRKYTLWDCVIIVMNNWMVQQIAPGDHPRFNTLLCECIEDMGAVRDCIGNGVVFGIEHDWEAEAGD